MEEEYKKDQEKYLKRDEFPQGFESKSAQSQSCEPWVLEAVCQ